MDNKTTESACLLQLEALRDRTAMASSSSISFSCAPSLVSTKSINHSPTRTLLSSRFLGTRNLKLRIRPARLGPSNGSRTTCWFKFGKNGVDAESAGIYGSQSRDDFDKDDVEQVLSSCPIKITSS